MDRATNKGKLLGFLQTIQKPGRPVEDLDEQEGLVAAGLIDSLALLEIIGYLEKEHGFDFATRGVDPGELRSISSILDLIEGRSA